MGIPHRAVTSVTRSSVRTAMNTLACGMSVLSNIPHVPILVHFLDDEAKLV